MDIIRLYIKLYDLIRNHKGIDPRLFSPLRKLIKGLANKRIRKNLEKNPANLKHSDTKDSVIVSLTSFPARIANVWQVVECMLRQTTQPAKIILWLSKEQFASKSELPKSLLIREGSIFEIRLVDGDIRSHKKYFYIAKEHPESLVFLVDDDLYYDSHIIERTIKEYNKHTNAIVCNYARIISRDNRGKILPYKTWAVIRDYSESNDLFFGSGGGTLFRPSQMYKELTNIEEARRLAPVADDIWLNAMARLNHQRIIHLKSKTLLGIINKHDVRLATSNLDGEGNDKQINNTNNKYNCF